MSEPTLADVKFVPLHSHVDSRRTMFRLYEMDDHTGDVNLSIMHPKTRTNFHMHKKQTDLVGVVKGELDWFVCNKPHRGKGFPGKINDDAEFRVIHLNPHILATQGMLYVPPGIYHASCNDFQEDAYLIYQIDQHYDSEDEFRMTWTESEWNWERKVK